ncbi:hypothetical protein R6Q57_022031 [Mikania cordata]
MAFSLHSIKSLPFRTKIPTVDSDTFLNVTTPASSDQVSIINVKILGSPVFDDGSLIVFGIENSFDPNFTVSEPPVSLSAGGTLRRMTFRILFGTCISDSVVIHGIRDILSLPKPVDEVRDGD